MFFGKKYNQGGGTSSKLATFKEAMQWKYVTHDIGAGGSANCDYRMLGDPHPGYQK